MELASAHSFKPITGLKRLPLHIRIGTMELIIHTKDKRPRWTCHNIDSLPKQIRI